MPAVTKRVYEVLGRRLKFDPKDKEAIGMWDTTEGEKFLAIFFLTFRTFLGVIGSFTLMVGGLGVSNIMYVVVEERTREIGIKLAVGAKPRFIQAQFLLETLTLTAVGGLLGFLVTLGILVVFPHLGLDEYIGTPEASPLVVLTTAALLGADRPRGRLLPRPPGLAARPGGGAQALMRYATTELALVWRLFRADLAHQRKRIVLTVLAIAWGTLSIVLLLSFGEGLKRSFNKGARGMGEGTAVVWPGATTRAYMGLPSGRPDPDQGGGPGTAARADSRDRAALGRVREVRAGDRGHEEPQRARARRGPGVRGDAQHPSPGRRTVPERARHDREAPRRRSWATSWRTISSGPRTSWARPCRSTSRRSWSSAWPRRRSRWACTTAPTRTRPRSPPRPSRRAYTGEKIANLVYRPVSLELGDTAKAQVYRVMGAKYHFDPEDTRALGIWDTREMQRINDNVAFGIQIFLGIIGGLTLFVGGMGVANIMYAVVKERTREIGVKMALGAKQRQVMLPFVFEALLMTVLGGSSAPRSRSG